MGKAERGRLFGEGGVKVLTSKCHSRLSHRAFQRAEVPDPSGGLAYLGDDPLVEIQDLGKREKADGARDHASRR